MSIIATNDCSISKGVKPMQPIFDGQSAPIYRGW